MQTDWFETVKKLTSYFSEAFSVRCTALDLSSKDMGGSLPDFCGACSKKGGGCVPVSTHLYGCYEAERWQGKYIYYCPDGLIFIACADGEAGAVAGPVVMGDPADFLSEREDGDRKRYRTLPKLTTTRVNAICETMGAAMRALKPEEGDAPLGAEMLNLMYTLSEGLAPYPIQSEKALLAAIREGDKAEAQRLLNLLLGHIYFCSGCDFKIIKVRVSELLALLSRASIEGGADIEEVFGHSVVYYKEIGEIRNLEELSIWLSGVMHRYISYVFDFLKIKHSDVIFKTIQFIRAHYSEKMALEEIAKNVYLSKSYLCKLFKEETGTNITLYINRLRVDKSKALLLNSALGLTDVASLTGFVDQSYYTKVFKKIAGLSPGKFRETSGKPGPYQNEGE